MLRLKRMIVTALERACALTHPFSSKHRPAEWSGYLDELWETGLWEEVVK